MCNKKEAVSRKVVRKMLDFKSKKKGKGKIELDDDIEDIPIDNFEEFSEPKRKPTKLSANRQSTSNDSSSSTSASLLSWVEKYSPRQFTDLKLHFSKANALKQWFQRYLLGEIYNFNDNNISVCVARI